MENPFAIFSCDSAQIIPLKDTDSSRNRSAPNPCNSSHISRCKAEAASPGKRRRRGDDASQSVQKKSIAGMEFMTRWWEDLRSLTSNYPFAVMITGVLGAQARDIVTVAALRRLAVRVDNDICPKKLSSFDVDSFEEIIRTVNHCRKKSKTIIDLSKIIERRTMPTTRIGLCQLPGVGPKISDIVLEIAYGHAPLDGYTQAINGKHDLSCRNSDIYGTVSSILFDSSSQDNGYYEKEICTSEAIPSLQMQLYNSVASKKDCIEIINDMTDLQCNSCENNSLDTLREQSALNLQKISSTVLLMAGMEDAEVSGEMSNLPSESHFLPDYSFEERVIFPVLKSFLIGKIPNSACSNDWAAESDDENIWLVSPPANKKRNINK